MSVPVCDGGHDAEVAELDSPAQQPLREREPLAQAEVRTGLRRRRSRRVADVGEAFDEVDLAVAAEDGEEAARVADALEDILI